MEPGFLMPLSGLEKFIPISDIPSRSTGSFPNTSFIFPKSLARSGAEPNAHNLICSKFGIPSPRFSMSLLYIAGTAINRVQARSLCFLDNTTRTVSGENLSSMITWEPAINAVWSSKHSPWI
jgi:hypothetical protein